MIQEEKIMKHATVCYLVKRDPLGNIAHVCLAKKTRKIGAGYRNGYGGGIEPGETEIANVIRETFEETKGTQVFTDSLEKVATIFCHNELENGYVNTYPVHIYIADVYRKEPESNEVEGMVDPRWYDTSNLSFLDEMMPADRDWFPHVLAGKKLLAHVYLSPFQKERSKPTEITFVTKL